MCGRGLLSASRAKLAASEPRHAVLIISHNQYRLLFFVMTRLCLRFLSTSATEATFSVGDHDLSVVLMVL